MTNNTTNITVITIPAGFEAGGGGFDVGGFDAGGGGFDAGGGGFDAGGGGSVAVKRCNSIIIV